MQRKGAHNELGQQGEDLAADFLQEKGMRVLGRNVWTKMGEVDLLMEDNRDLVIVEVKTIRDNSLFDPADKIDWQKRKKLRQLASLMAVLYSDRFIRIDAVTVVWPKGEEPKVEHLRDILG